MQFYIEFRALFGKMAYSFPGGYLGLMKSGRVEGFDVGRGSNYVETQQNKSVWASFSYSALMQERGKFHDALDLFIDSGHVIVYVRPNYMNRFFTLTYDKYMDKLHYTIDSNKVLTEWYKRGKPKVWLW